MSEERRPLTGNIRPDRRMITIEDYENTGGYQALRKALKQMSPGSVVDEVTASTLRGLGGAGFPTGMKWASVQTGEQWPTTRYFIADADEMEPGAFKDRMLLEGNPHQLLEGLIIGSYAVGAQTAYVFLRWEYTEAARKLTQAIQEAYQRQYVGSNILGSGYGLELHLHISSGRYICGEATAMARSIEGDRAVPLCRPPRQGESGLWAKPTVVDNVETLSNIPHIVNNGSEWFKGLSLSGTGGTKIYGASGRVKRPGLWELPMGTPLREIVEEHAGGMQVGYRLRAVIPGGASTEFLPPEKLDVPMDFESVAAAGSRLGTGTIIVLDDRTCPVGAVHNLIAFFARESCGWCTPCREGLAWLKQILRDIEDGRGRPEDLEILMSHTRRLWFGRTYCALAPGAMEPLKSALVLFRHDFEEHIKTGRCRWRS